jgi:DNA-binding NtrC family response regulator
MVVATLPEIQLVAMASQTAAVQGGKTTMEQSAVLLFELYPGVASRVATTLLRAGIDMTQTASRDQVLKMLGSSRGRIVVIGPSSSAKRDEALDLVLSIRDSYNSVAIVLVVADSSEDLAIAALRAGVNEYVRLAELEEELPAAVARCMRLTESTAHSPSDGADADGGIIGQSPAMRTIRARIEKIAQSDSNVLITGETGTGKELFAELVHRKSRRRHHPFVAINCAAIPDTLLESELFGHSKGAFTGADAVQDGRLKAANRGTVFLDEIGDMSAYSQAKILRVLENKEIQRLGCARGIPVDVRVVAATNQDLEQLARENKFRRDLFFRLNVAHIHLPPLRERKEDLPALIEHYVEHFNREFRARIRRVTDGALHCLFAYDWPGNIRELKNVLESVFAEGPQAEIALEDLPVNFRMRCAELKSLPADERGRLLWALTATNWNKSKAAQKLQWSRMTLYRKMERYNILQKPDADTRTAHVGRTSPA